MTEFAKPHGDLFYRTQPQADAFGRLALQLTLRTLRAHGNQISKAHRQLLWDMTWLCTIIANGNEWGRHVVDMPTGGGKTTSVVCFAKALVHHGPPDWSMAICTGRVEEMEDLYGLLVSGDCLVDPKHIGVWHSKPEASVPPTFPVGSENRYGERRLSA